MTASLLSNLTLPFAIYAGQIAAQTGFSRIGTSGRQYSPLSLQMQREPGSDLAPKTTQQIHHKADQEYEADAAAADGRAAEVKTAAANQQEDHDDK